MRTVEACTNCMASNDRFEGIHTEYAPPAGYDLLYPVPPEGEFGPV
jgi:hypothetical protein